MKTETALEKAKALGILTEIQLSVPLKIRHCTCLWPYPTNCLYTCNGEFIAVRAGFENMLS